MGDTKLTITPNSTGEMVVEECLKKYNVSFDPLTNFVYNSTQVGVFASLSDPDGNDFMMLLMLETMILLLRERSLLLRFRRDHAVLPNEMILRGINRTWSVTAAGGSILLSPSAFCWGSHFDVGIHSCTACA